MNNIGIVKIGYSVHSLFFFFQKIYNTWIECAYMYRLRCIRNIDVGLLRIFSICRWCLSVSLQFHLLIALKRARPPLFSFFFLILSKFLFFSFFSLCSFLLLSFFSFRFFSCLSCFFSFCFSFSSFCSFLLLSFLFVSFLLFSFPFFYFLLLASL